MKTLFLGQDMWDIIENGYMEPRDQEAYNSLTQVEKDALKYQRKKDGKEILYINKAIYESTLPRVASINQAKEA
jgi:hypothetical protein